MNKFSATIEHRAIDTITPYHGNSKQHPQEQIDKLASMMAEYGHDVPIVVDGDGVIIKGHGRLLACKKLGMATVPVIVRDDLTPAQAKSARIADNKVSESDWDMDMLKIELAELGEMDFDIDLTGFGDFDFSLDDGEQIKEVEMPELRSGDREPFQQMTFTLHDEQVEQIKAACDIAKKMGEFNTPNENSNGNALARVCEIFMTHYGNS